ncbi:MAG: LytTR family DNA-binding domain-containing protein [Bacteroidota bacterium]
MRIVIVDDEDLARGVLREHCEHHPDISIVAECRNGFEAVKAVAETKPDLLFLDVQMPKLNGLEVLELLDPVPAIIFVTAYDMYAVKAFDVHAVDYLLKPFSRERFEEALQRARERIVDGTVPDFSAVARENLRHAPAVERILIRDGTKVHIISADAIDYIEAQDDYVSVHSGGKAYLKPEALSGLEASLDPARFIRIHRSYILNIDRLSRLETYAKDSRIAILKDGTRLPISRKGFDKLKDLL